MGGAPSARLQGFAVVHGAALPPAPQALGFHGESSGFHGTHRALFAESRMSAGRGIPVMSDEGRQDTQDTRRKITMMRVAVIVAGVLGMTTFAVHDAAALSARNSALRADRPAECPAHPAGGPRRRDHTAARCHRRLLRPEQHPDQHLRGQLHDHADDVPGRQRQAHLAPCAIPAPSRADGVTSCREAFDAAILACKNIKTPNGQPDFDKQIACQSRRPARIASSARRAARPRSSPHRISAASTSATASSSAADRRSELYDPLRAPVTPRESRRTGASSFPGSALAGSIAAGRTGRGHSQPARLNRQ